MKAFSGTLAVLMLWASQGVAAPVVFWASDPVGPGETALLFGDGLGAKVTAEGWQAADGPVSGPPDRPPGPGTSPAQPLEVLQASEVCAKVLLPSGWKAGLYVVRLSNGSGQSVPVFLNRAQPWWWLGGPGDQAIPGQEIRVFGKNLGGSTRAWLTAGDQTVALPVVDARSYAAAYRVPEGVKPGEYRLWVHNGRGGALGFGDPLRVRVASPPPWPADRFDVRRFGARGDGVADDTAALTAALAKAGANGGGVVYLPRGRYKITAKLVVPPRTTLRGEKREWVWFYTPKELPEFDGVLAGNGDFAVAELSLVSQTARRLVVCPDDPAMYHMPWPHPPAAGRLGHNVCLHRLRLQHLRYAHRLPKGSPLRLEDVGPTTVALAGPDMELSDCDVVSSGQPLKLQDAHHGRITGNRLTTGRQGWYDLEGADETVFEGNDISGGDLEGSYGGVQGKAYRLYIAGNRWHDAYGDEREALTFDTPYHPTWIGKAASARGTSLVGADAQWKAGGLKGQACMIAHGKGLGQYIPVADNTENTLTLEHAWAVAPDDGSTVVVRANKSDVVIADNAFADASAAVQLYAQSFGFIIDGNRAERTGGSYGIGSDFIDSRKRRRYSTCCFNQWLNNDFSQGFVYQQGAFLHGVLGPCASKGTPAPEPPAIPTVGNVVRNNTVRDHFTIGALYFARHPLIPPRAGADFIARDTLIEGNRIADSPLALDVYPLYTDTVLRNNRVERCAVPLRDDGLNTWIHPAERLGYQVRAAAELLGEEADLGAFDRSVAEMSRQAAGSPELARRSAQLREELWAQVARRRPRGVSPEVLAMLVGLRYEAATNTALTRALAAGGTADLGVRARTESWSPAVTVGFEVVAPPGWKVAPAGTATAIRPGELVDLKTRVTVPEKVEVTAISVRFTVTLGGVSLKAEGPWEK